MIAKIFRYFKNLLSSSSGKELSENEEKIPGFYDNENVISFVLNPENKLIIRISLQNLKEVDIDSFAYTLLQINGGYLSSQIISMLQELGNEDPKRYIPITRLLNSWAEMIDTEKKMRYNISNNKPIVSPLQFSKSVKTEIANE